MGCVTLLAAIERSSLSRGNQLGDAGWTAIANALERVTSLTSLNGCDEFREMRAGGLQHLELEHDWELWGWASLFLERSASTLTWLDVRSQGWEGKGGGVGAERRFALRGESA